MANYAPFNIFNELENNYIDLGVLDAKFQFELKYKPIRGLELSALGASSTQPTSQQHNIKDNSNQALAYRAMPNGIIRDANKFLSITIRTIPLNCLTRCSRKAASCTRQTTG